MEKKIERLLNFLGLIKNPIGVLLFSLLIVQSAVLVVQVILYLKLLH